MFETGKQWTYGQAARSRNANIITHRLKKSADRSHATNKDNSDPNEKALVKIGGVNHQLGNN